VSIYSKFFAIDGKTAVITGAGSGIGQAVALAFVEAGATVVAADLNEDGLEETVSAAANRAGIRVVVADVSSPDSIRELADQADKLFGRVDFLVNNAAISRRHPAEAFPEEDWTGSLRSTSRALSCAPRNSAGGCWRRARAGSST